MHTLDDSYYVPSIGWRQGEYLVLKELSADQKNKTIPLLTLPYREFDFEDGKPEHNTQKFVDLFIKRYLANWGTRPSWVRLDDRWLSELVGGKHHIFEYLSFRLQTSVTELVPAIALNSDTATVDAVRFFNSQHKRGVGTTLSSEDLMSASRNSNLTSLAGRLGLNLADLDILLDLRVKNFTPYEVLANVLLKHINQLSNFGLRNIVTISSSIPESLSYLEEGISVLPRHEWGIYKQIRSKLAIHDVRPIFGDYTTIYPKFEVKNVPALNAKAKIIYTSGNNWFIVKGSKFRGNEEQMHDHCAEIMKNSRSGFSGSVFSLGDKYIEDCANRIVEPSNLQRWIRVAISHHIPYVLRDLSHL